MYSRWKKTESREITEALWLKKAWATTHPNFILVVCLRICTGFKGGFVQRDASMRALCQGKKKYTPPPWRPPFFSFSGSEALWFIPLFPDLWCIPFSLVWPGKGYTPLPFFALRPWGRATDREKRGLAVVVYTLFSPALVGQTKLFS